MHVKTAARAGAGLAVSGAVPRVINPEALSRSRDHRSTIAALQTANEELRALNRKLQETLERCRSAWDGRQNGLCGAISAKHCFDDCLTPRQRQVMTMVLDGHPSKNIAAELKISRRTVENHRASIMLKTGAKSLPALVRLALAADALEGPPRHQNH